MIEGFTLDAISKARYVVTTTLPTLVLSLDALRLRIISVASIPSFRHFWLRDWNLFSAWCGFGQRTMALALWSDAIRFRSAISPIVYASS